MSKEERLEQERTNLNKLASEDFESANSNFIEVLKANMLIVTIISS